MKRTNDRIWLNVITFELVCLLLLIPVNIALSFFFNNSTIALYTQYVLWFFTFFLVLSVLISLFKLYKLLKLENHECENTINALKNEIEKQNKLVNNLSNLYNNMAEYDNYKTEFFSNISHDLKTPLTVILGALQLIDQKKASISTERRKSNRHMQTIKHNCYRLLRLVNNILDISRIDSGYIKLNFVNVNIVYLIEEITQSVAPYAEQKGLSLEFDTETEEIITAVDIDKIERIILNLLSNAIKFTPCGGKIRVNTFERNNRVVFTVKDTGLGIPENMHSIIFERFRQADTSLTREYEGSGIGLSLVRSFVELHSGCISVISEENKGSEFIIELPVRQCELSKEYDYSSNSQNIQSKIVEAINIEFSDIYSAAS